MPLRTGAGTNCLSGRPEGSRLLTAGCTCDWCGGRQDKVKKPRDIALVDVLMVVRHHYNCKGNILGVMAMSEATEQEIRGFLCDAGFTTEEIKVGRVALDAARSFVKKLTEQGYKWDPTNDRPIAPKVK